MRYRGSHNPIHPLLKIMSMIKLLLNYYIWILIQWRVLKRASNNPKLRNGLNHRGSTERIIKVILRFINIITLTFHRRMKRSVTCKRLLEQGSNIRSELGFDLYNQVLFHMGSSCSSLVGGFHWTFSCNGRKFGWQAMCSSGSSQMKLSQIAQ